MLNKKSIKTLIANSIAAYHQQLVATSIETAVDNHNDVMATASQAGHMSSAQVTKLAGIAEGAEVNQNALANVKVGNVTVTAGSKTDTVTFVAGDNVELEADAAAKTVTVKGAYETFGVGSAGLVPAGSDDATKFLAANGSFKVIQDGTTAQKGIVQLNDATDSTSTVQAATANAVKKALDAAKTYADGVKSQLLGDAPAEALDTLKELGDALNNDANFAATMTTSLAGKSDIDHTHVGSDLKVGTYEVQEGDIAGTDTIAVAIGKVDKKVADLADSGASHWAQERTMTVSGAVTGSVAFDGSKNFTLNTTLSNLASDKVTAMTGYDLAGITSDSNVAAADSLNTAIAKVEYRAKNITLAKLFDTDKTGANLAAYGIEDAYTSAQGTALAGRVSTLETLCNTTLGGAESVTSTDVDDIMTAVQDALK